MKLSTIALAKKYAKPLNELLDTPVPVEELTSEKFVELGAKAVVLDHDGILGPSRSELPDETGMEILKNAIEAFGAGSVFILSNTSSKRDIREQKYRNLVEGVRYIKSERKPDPAGLKIASDLSGVPVDKIAVVDDGVLTGVVMAVSSGAIPVYAKRRRLKESLFAKSVRLVTTLPQIAIVRVLGLSR